MLTLAKPNRAAAGLWVYVQEGRVGIEYIPEGDLYEVLAVTPEASSDEIALAHRRQIRVHHPDVGGNDAKASALNFARDVLTDPIERRRYDRLRSAHFAELASGCVEIRAPEPWSPAAVPAATVHGTGLGTALVYPSIKAALRSGYRLRAVAFAILGHLVNQAVDDATDSDPGVRSAVDVIAEWMQARSIGRERQARRERIRARLVRLERRSTPARAAARKPARKKKRR